MKLFISFALPAATVLASAVPAAAETYLARCQMGECVYYDQTEHRIVGEGSTAVPGDVVEVTLRSAASESESASAANLVWGEPSEVRFFCSKARPAYQQADGTFVAWDLTEWAGATTMVTAMYVHACHPGVEIASGDPFGAALALGYEATPGGTYPSLQALVSP
uniref:hypothetical protein n=1 Tax=Paracoccus marcusii TaxID=59779 RepID=UPI00155DBBF4|nr:hypothetical protein [Paracoccus marcusii]